MKYTGRFIMFSVITNIMGYVTGLRALSANQTLSSTPYRQLENQSTKYYRQ
jgi:maleate cis-trans isomerase